MASDLKRWRFRKWPGNTQRRPMFLPPSFSRDEDYGLKSQMNCAVNSINLNIAEGTAKNSNKAFAYHLEIALGSTFEMVAGSFIAKDREYMTETEQEGLYEYGQRLAKSINAFRNTLPLS